MAVTEALTRPVGPLAAWQWGLVFVGGFFAYKFLKGGSTPSFSSGGGTVVGGTGSSGTGIDTSGFVTMDDVGQIVADQVAGLTEGPPGPAGPAGPAGPPGPVGGTIVPPPVGGALKKFRIQVLKTTGIYNSKGKLIENISAGNKFYVTKQMVNGAWRWVITSSSNSKLVGGYLSIDPTKTKIVETITAPTVAAAAALPNQLSISTLAGGNLTPPNTTAENQSIQPVELNTGVTHSGVASQIDNKQNIRSTTLAV